MQRAPTTSYKENLAGAHEDTVFARINLLAASAKAAA